LAKKEEPAAGDAGRAVTTTDADRAMARYAGGDAKAFEIVYDVVAPRLAGYLRKRVREATRIEDLIQQTFMQMHSARGSFIPGAAVLPWAYAIARHLSIDSGRKARREIPYDLSDDGDAGSPQGRPLVSSAPSGEDMVQARETGKHLAAAMATLSAEQRAALDLRTQDLSGAKIAFVLGTTSVGVRLRIHRALMTLRRALTERRAPSASIAPANENPK
jgi:RNA polymerase sigma-70 factor, ECF subfamily